MAPVAAETPGDAVGALVPPPVPAAVSVAAEPSDGPAQGSAKVVEAISPPPPPMPPLPGGPPPVSAPAMEIEAEKRSEPPGEVPAEALETIVQPLPPLPPIPGAYLAPAAIVRSPRIAAPPLTADTEAQQALHAPGSDAVAPRSDAATQGSDAATPGSGGAAPGPPPRVPVLELPFVVAPGPGPRLVAAGSALAAFAFVLPWVSGGAVVLGSAFGSGYFSSWGLAAIANLLPFLVALAGLALAVLPNRVPPLAALGVLPAVLGGVLAGIAWTYLIAGSGTGIGIWALAAGAILLAAGGSLVLVGDRSRA